MRKITSFLLILVLIFGLLASSCGGNSQTEQSTDTPQSTAPSNEPEKTERKIYEHVLIVGIGSAGAFFADADTPNIDRVFENGSITYKARAESLTKSEPCWASMLHGVEYSAHKILENEEEPYPSDSEFPSVFRAVKEQNPNASVTVIGDSFFTVSVIEENLGVNTIEANGDFAVAEAACSYLDQNDAPNLMFVCFDSPDTLGHIEGFGSVGHLSAIRNTDTFFGYIYERYEKQGILDDTLVIVTSNHGGFGIDHGSNKNEEKYVMFAASGESVIKNVTPEDMYIRDLPSVIMYAFGLECPDGWTARLPKGIFDGAGGGEREFYIDKNTARYRETLETPQKDSEKHITNFITDKNLQYYLTFDETTEDSLGNTVEATDDYYYIDGVFGKSIWLDNGYLTIPDYSTEQEGFTVAMWVRSNSVFSDTPIITNRSRDDINNNGFTLYLADEKTIAILSTGNGSDSSVNPHKIPTDYADGWMHVIFTYSPEEGKAKISFDFGKFKTISLKDSMTGDIFNNGSPLYIGYEPSTTDSYTFNGAIDEFMQFDGSFSDEDVANLAAYYAK